MNKAVFTLLSVVFVCFLVLLVTINKLHLNYSLLSSPNKAVFQKQKPNNVLAASTKGNRTYTSKEGGYSITYPASWTPDLLPPPDTSNSGIPVFSTGPVGNKILGYPSFIKIVVNDNLENLSLDDYVKQHLDSSLTFKPVTFVDKQGEEALNNQGTVPTETVIFENNNNVYEIIWYQGAEPKITQQQFKQFLAGMQFL